MYINVYIFMYVYVYLFMYIYIHTYVYIYIYMYINKYFDSCNAKFTLQVAHKFNFIAHNPVGTLNNAIIMYRP